MSKRPLTEAERRAFRALAKAAARLQAVQAAAAQKRRPRPAANPAPKGGAR